MSILATSAAATTAGNTLTTSAGITTTTGMAGVAFVQTLSAQPLSTFTDTAGNNWHVPGTPTFNVSISSVSFYIYLCYAQNITGGTNQFYTSTITNGPIYTSFSVQLFTGCPTSGTLFDGSVATFSDTGTVQSHTGPSITTSTNGSNIAMMGWDASVAADVFTAGSGYAISTNNNSTLR